MPKLVVLGAGESGTGAALLAQARGYNVFVSDAGRIAASYKAALMQHQIPFEEQGHTWSRIRAADEIVKSPGIASHVPLIQQVMQVGIPIIDEIELASRYTKAYLIAITGSNGKTTTTHLTHHLLQSAGLDVEIAGNMGESFARKVLAQDRSYYVLEVSCFQLEGMYQCKADVAILLNITPDHLDRYGQDMQPYVQAKWRILRNMTAREHFIYNQDDAHIQHQLQQAPLAPTTYPVSLAPHDHSAAYVQDAQLCLTRPAPDCYIPTRVLRLPGQHNQMNALAAMTAARLVGVSPHTIQAALSTFQGMPHRIAWVAQLQGVDYYNDSKATNVAATYVALASFERPILWIAGGYDKGNDYGTLEKLVRQRVKALIGLGKDNAPLRRAFRPILPHIYETQDIHAATAIAHRLAQPGDVVLLSPACASFDLFTSFEDRGNAFQTAVEAIQQAQR
ncbi:MAG: UDP-N-acetylmuramoyl-L-alanine--D-glutamate ligase [Bacteroidota bacterium]